MDAAFKRTFHKVLVRLLIICLLTNWLILGLYFFKFAPGNWFELSSSQEIWAHFGTFYSGLLGPFLAFLAFLGILFTVILQIKQLELSKQQAEIQEMQQVLASISSQIDQMLNVIPTYHAVKDRVRKDVAPMTVLGHISAFGTALLNPTEDTDLELGFNAVILKDLQDDISTSVRAITLELHNLGWALEAYTKAGGSKTITQFYEFRYGVLVVYLDAMEELHDTSRIRSVFDLEQIKKSLVSEAKPESQE